MSAVWYTSDSHFGHKLVSGLRGFDNTDDHDEVLCENWIANVKAGGTVYHLGDVTLGGTGKVLRALDIVRKLPGRKVLVAGNHDPIHPMHRDPLKFAAEFNDVFAYCTTYMRRSLAGQLVEMCHFPFTEDHTENPRHMHHRRPDFGQWLVHGHTHSSEQVNGREIHVGLDAHDLKPVNQEWVVQQITEGLKNV